MDSEAQLAMNLGETYLVTETGNERLGKQKLDLVVLQDQDQVWIKSQNLICLNYDNIGSTIYHPDNSAKNNLTKLYFKKYNAISEKNF